MEGFIRIKHDFNCGDLITVLPGLRQLYRDTGKKVKVFQRLNLESHYYDSQINSTVNNEGKSVCMNNELFYMMKPLIEAQDYIESFKIWEGQAVDLDYSVTRDMKSIPMPYGLIHTWGEAVFPQTSTNLSERWINLPFLKIDIDVIPKLNPVGLIRIFQETGKYMYRSKDEDIGYSNKVLINRTQRYNNPYVTYYFLKSYESQLLFSGTEAEHKDFCEKNKLDLELLKVDNFLELSRIIDQCKFGIFNQSLHWHLADAMKTKRILEVCAAFPNTFGTGKNAYHAFGQAAMEFYFNKLISQ